MIVETDAVSAYPPELVSPGLSYADWLQITRFPANLTAAATMLWGYDSNFAYGIWRAQNRESVYQCQRIIAGWFQPPDAGNRERGRRNRKHGKRANRLGNGPK